ncbi:MAG: tetratricopeptide repeat protein [Flavobacteriales bacterium]|nr:tetratricopeptide repeat protein [Flavobacteriales bacterium]MBK9534088.1 tetratricopeptide repeat protein [Flavobacteriales bacterium]MBP9137444.1 tetratricopeptide repeat protein [Flavobacteriales bacterium]
MQMVLFSGTVQAQPNGLDSLKYAASNTLAPDSLRAQALGNLVKGFAGMGMEDSALVTARELVRFCTRIKATERIMLAKGMLGKLHGMVGAYDSARYYLEAVRDHHHTLTNTTQESEAELSIGLSYHLQGYYPQAITHCMKGIRLAEDIMDTATLSHGYVNLSAIYVDVQQPDQAIIPLEKAIVLMRATRNPRIRNALAQMGIVHNMKGDHVIALQFLEESLALSLKDGDMQSASRILNDMGNTQRELLRYPEALASFSQAATLTRSSYTLIQNKIGEGATHIAMGNANKAIPLLKEAAEMAKVDDDLADEAAAYKELSMAYTDLGNTEKAFQVFKQHIVLRDSLISKENTREMTRVEMNYTFEKTQLADSLSNEAEKEQTRSENLTILTKEKNRRDLLLLSGIGLLVFAGGLGHRLRETRRSRAAIQKEKDISEGLLLNILPAEVAAELKAKGEAAAVQIDLVTVLFTDFKGFTALSEILSPRELVKDLNECFSGFDRITGEYGIEKIKTFGDAYMAAGGLPTPNATHASDVVQAALEMRDFVAKEKARKIAAGLPFFEVRIGIHTGPVVAGIVGVKKFQYDIWGDTVNTASRMESSGEVGQVNISEATHELVKDEPGLSFTSRGKVQTKGKGEMEMYFVKRI